MLGKDFKNKAEKNRYNIEDLKKLLNSNKFSIVRYEGKILGPIEFLEKTNVLFKIVFNLGSVFKKYANYIYILAYKNEK